MLPAKKRKKTFVQREMKATTETKAFHADFHRQLLQFHAAPNQVKLRDLLSDNRKQ